MQRIERREDTARIAKSIPKAGLAALIGILLLGDHCPRADAQATSPNPATTWVPSTGIRTSLKLDSASPSSPSPVAALIAGKRYTLAELVNLAETHNPETRAAWQQARVQAARAGVARSALLPTLSGLVLGQTIKTGVLFGPAFVLQREGIGEAALELDYTIFDYGQRQQALAAARDDLFAANFAFNNTHLSVLYRVTDAYYRLLDAMGQVAAAEINLNNATTDAENADARLAQGLATLPDALEARAAAAQATYDLASVEGARQIALGDLLTVIGLPVSTPLNVQPLDDLAPPAIDEETADSAISRALAGRPDLLEQVARIRAADERIREARSAYLPRLTFSGNLGEERAYGEQFPLPSTYATADEWNAQLNLSWTLFDGGRRSSELQEAHAERREAASELDQNRDRAADQVWTAYANMKTALAQQRAAQTLLDAANTSYNAAIEAYQDGVRTVIDVVAAQRTLAQARSQEVTARARVFRQTAALAFRTGDLLRQPQSPPILNPAPAQGSPAPASPAPAPFKPAPAVNPLPAQSSAPPVDIPPPASAKPKTGGGPHE